MRAADIAYLGDWTAAKLRRTRHPPTRHGNLALAVCAIADDRGHLIGKDPRKQRKIASEVMGSRETIRGWRPDPL
jgi:hypothetical protein